MLEALQYDFMRNALLAGLLVSIATGVIGAFVVSNRMVFVSGGIAHAAYGGIGLGYLLGINPILGAFGFSVAAAMGMGVVQRRAGQRSDAVIGVMWAVGMAAGVVMLDLAPGYKPDLLSYLFGSILAVPRGDLALMAALDVVVVTLVAAFYRPLLAMSFDETFARVRNVPVEAMQMVLLGLVAIAVVLMMRVVGLILVIAMLTIPVSIATQFLRDMRAVMAVSSLLGAAFTLVGLALSYAWNLTSGAAIILVAGAAYLVALAASSAVRRLSFARSASVPQR